MKIISNNYRNNNQKLSYYNKVNKMLIILKMN